MLPLTGASRVPPGNCITKPVCRTVQANASQSELPVVWLPCAARRIELCCPRQLSARKQMEQLSGLKQVLNPWIPALIKREQSLIFRLGVRWLTNKSPFIMAESVMWLTLHSLRTHWTASIIGYDHVELIKSWAHTGCCTESSCPCSSHIHHKTSFGSLGKGNMFARGNWTVFTSICVYLNVIALVSPPTEFSKRL